LSGLRWRGWGLADAADAIARRPARRLRVMAARLFSSRREEERGDGPDRVGARQRADPQPWRLLCFAAAAQASAFFANPDEMAQDGEKVAAFHRCTSRYGEGFVGSGAAARLADQRENVLLKASRKSGRVSLPASRQWPTSSTGSTTMACTR
jgi:hypothetical protein